MKTIAIVSKKMITGGVEKALIAMLKKFDYSKLSVDLYLEQLGGEQISNLPKEVNVYQIPVLKNKDMYRHSILVLKKLFYSLIIKFRKHSYVEECFYASQMLCPITKKYDYAISYHAPNTIPVFYVIDKIKAHKKILWLHGDLDTNSGDDKLLIKYYEKYDKFFAVSKKIVESFNRFHPTRCKDIEVFYNYVDTQQIINLAKEGPTFENSNCFNILTIGRLDKQKGYDLAIKACKMLSECGYEFKWYVCGEGSERKRIEELIRIYNLKNTFILLGNQSNPYGYLADCDLYVQPSLTEGYCTTTNEARMLCKAVITTDVSGAQEQFLDNETGWIVPINYNSIYKKIKYCFEHKNEIQRVKNNLKKQSNIDNSVDINELLICKII